jgi:hypothetical protein
VEYGTRRPKGWLAASQKQVSLTLSGTRAVTMSISFALRSLDLEKDSHYLPLHCLCLDSGRHRNARFAGHRVC